MKFPLILFPFLPHALADFNGLRKLGNDKCDKDGDGFISVKCGGDDCDDKDSFIHPDAIEICGNDIDDNCNGEIDEMCIGEQAVAVHESGFCAPYSFKNGSECTSDLDCGGSCSEKSEIEGAVCMSHSDCHIEKEKGFCVFNIGSCLPITDSPTIAPSTTPSATSSPSVTMSENPSSSPTESMAPSTAKPATYVPGELSVKCEGVTMSTGLKCALLTEAGQRVKYTDGSGDESSDRMHFRADGAGVVPHPYDGGWYYVSNSESSFSGGVGSIRFNKKGEVIGYERNLKGTKRNCGGGVSPWNTWITAEENDTSGFLYEVDPYTGHTKKINVVANGGNYESFAYDDQDPHANRYFVTEDVEDGALVRYTPAESAYNTGNIYDILSSKDGTHEYLVLSNDGTFEWSAKENDGKKCASKFFPNAEGIDVHDRVLYFVSKEKKLLFELDLSAQTWTKSSTVSGAFNLQPDQLGRIVGERDVLYFCEDGGTGCDIHGRDSTGKYFTIVKGTKYDSESTGLAFSPDNMFMYVAFQEDSHVYAFWREDGYPFSGSVADTKYH